MGAAERRPRFIFIDRGYPTDKIILKGSICRKLRIGTAYKGENMFKLEELLESQIDKNKKPFIYLAEGSLDKDARPLAAAYRLSEFSNVVLIGKPGLMKENAANSKMFAEYAAKINMQSTELIAKTLERVEVIDPETQETAEKRKIYGAGAFKLVGQKWKKSETELIEMMKDHLLFAIMGTAEIDGYGRDGHAVLGGLYSTTGSFFGPGLRLHPRSGTVFEAGVFSFQDDNCPRNVYPGNIVIFGDVAVVTEMSAEKLADVAVGTCKIARDLLPEKDFPEIYGSIVSYSTKGSGAGPTVDMTREAYKIIADSLNKLSKIDPLYKQIHITPEVQYAVAVNGKQAERKLDINDPVNAAAGRSNVIILPNLDFGNSMYHLHSAYYPDSQKILCVGGFKNNSILDFSRGQKIEEVILGGMAVILRQQYLQDFNPKLGK
jgi:phosphotransacetylase